VKALVMNESSMTETSPLLEERSPSRWLHRWAVLIVCLVWPLIWVGGLVTTYDAGMAVPDWPGTYGKNLFLYPYTTWLFGPFDLFIEHGHRLLGAVVGFLAIIAMGVAWRTESRRWVRWLSVLLLVTVISQGVLGGMRVVLGDRTLAMAHGCTGPLFFVICVCLAVVTGKWWKRQAPRAAEFTPSRGMVRLAAVATTLAYVQLVLGAQLRHVQVTASPRGFTHLVSTHITGAFVLWIIVGILAWRLRKQEKRLKAKVAVSFENAATVDKDAALTERTATLDKTSPQAGCGDLTLSRPATLLVGFVALQIALGLGTWIANYGWPTFAQIGPTSAGYLVKSKAFTESIVTTAHVATGSLILALGAVVWLRLLRVRFCVATVSMLPKHEKELHSPAEERQGLQVL
jgi:cytochrome c oxidase assembly protein subunit 15